MSMDNLRYTFKKYFKIGQFLIKDNKMYKIKGAYKNLLKVQNINKEISFLNELDDFKLIEKKRIISDEVILKLLKNIDNEWSLRSSLSMSGIKFSHFNDYIRDNLSFRNALRYYYSKQKTISPIYKKILQDYGDK